MPSHFLYENNNSKFLAHIPQVYHTSSLLRKIHRCRVPKVTEWKSTNPGPKDVWKSNSDSSGDGQLSWIAMIWISIPSCLKILFNWLSLGNGSEPLVDGKKCTCGWETFVHEFFMIRNILQLMFCTEWMLVTYSRCRFVSRPLFLAGILLIHLIPTVVLLQTW